jgi:D-aminopeptidase
VIPDRVGGWRVERQGAEHPQSRHDSATEAEDAAVNAARDAGTADVVVHDRYDRVHRVKS